VQLAVPTELGGLGSEGTNPEQLLAAGYAACFLGAVKVAGQQLKVRIPSDALFGGGWLAGLSGMVQV
jgi:lipoyl-dependent peroxiredoxin